MPIEQHVLWSAVTFAAVLVFGMLVDSGGDESHPDAPCRLTRAVSQSVAGSRPVRVLTGPATLCRLASSGHPVRYTIGAQACHDGRPLGRMPTLSAPRVLGRADVLCAVVGGLRSTVTVTRGR